MSGPSLSWITERRQGHAGDLHRLPDPDRPLRMARVLDVDRPALVLGSAQQSETVDAARAERSGVEVVRRRSGGGAVLLRPSEQIWIDLLVPAGDSLWNDDVVVAAWWAGEAWAKTIDRLGSGPARVHRGGILKSPWSDLICFAGLGPGEVSVASRKIVGISQRRSREWTRIQTIAFVTFVPDALVDLLALTTDERTLARAAVTDSVSELSADRADVVTSLLESLPR